MEGDGKIMAFKKRFLALLLSGVILLALNANAANEPVEWKTIIFGQSTSAENNQIVIDKDNNTVTLTSGTKDGSKTGGKVAKAHDGISYYYTEVSPSKNFELSAKIKVNFFAKATPDNQEAFGIMARDAIGKNLDATVFASNMVMVGGYRGLIQSVFRNNVKDISGSGAVMEDVYKFGERPANDGTATYKMTLKKTNTGYHAIVDNGKEKIYYRPKQFEVIDKNKIYVGFFTARVASITVSDITFKTSDVATDPAGLPEPPKPVDPAITVLSLNASPVANYDLKVLPNVKGNLEVKQNGTSVFNGPITKTGTVVKKLKLVKGENFFELLFKPDPNENITKTDPVSLKHVVTYKTYGKVGGILFVSPDGKATAAGTKTDPIDIYSALQFTQAGQTIYVLGGIYKLTRPLVISQGNDGTKAKPKILSSYSTERPVFDFGKKSQGFSLMANYWRIYGIDITNASSTGFRISGNHNLVKQVNTYANGDTGLQISGSSLDKIDKWPSYNLILNCNSFDNRDPSENNADGFAAKLTAGVGNVFRGCIAHHNADDGWDLYSKLETGPIGAVTIENCIAYSNGYLSDGTRTKGDGNGFKLGGEGLVVKHILKNSLAFKNRSMGITNNSDPAIVVLNTTSADNEKGNYNFQLYTNAVARFVAKNNISFRTTSGADDILPDSLRSADNYFYKGNVSVNIRGKKVTASDFKSVTPAEFKRSAKGNILANDYMILKPNSPIKGGYNVK